MLVFSYRCLYNQFQKALQQSFGRKEGNPVKKRLLSILLTVALLLSLAPGALAAEYGEITGTFTYCPALGMVGVSDQEQTFTYSDANFTQSGYRYRKALAVSSMELTMAAFGSSSDAGYEGASQNLQALLEKCGFDGFAANEAYATRPTADSIGVGAAYKTIHDNGGAYTLVAVGLRGHNYYGEWGGNFRVDETGDHAGFVLCRDQVLDFLRAYLADAGITGRIKLWMVGYSRSAATANLVGAALDDGASLGDGVRLSRHDLYCYCFEPPMGTVAEDASDPIYGNIHNIVNDADVVPQVLPEQWNFTRYGVDHVVPYVSDADYTALRDAMLQEFQTFDLAGAYLIDSFRMVSLDLTRLGTGSALRETGETVTQREFYDRLIDAALQDMIPSRADYVANLQEDLIELTTTLFGFDGGSMGTAMTLFAAKVSENAETLLDSLTISGAIENGTLAKLLEQYLFESLNEAGVNGYDAQQVRRMAGSLAVTVTKFALKHPDLAATLMVNLMTILSAHFPELCLSWLRTLPEEYMANQQTYAYSGVYSDVAGEAWYALYTDYVTAGGLMYGVGGGLFEPDAPMTRAMFAAVLYRLEGDPAVTGSSPFTDLKEDWYRDAVTWAYQAGVVAGVSDTAFAPDELVTREQMIAMLYRYAARDGVLDASGTLAGYTDAGQVSDWALPAMRWAVSSGIMAGMTETTLAPQGSSTRAQAAAFLVRFCEM